MKIIPEYGTDQILFGSTKQDCIKTYGPPTKEVIDDSGDINLYYFDLGLALKLEQENNGLVGWIQVSNPRVSLLGIKPIGQKASVIIEQLKQTLGSNIEEQNLDDWQSIVFEDYWLEIQVSLGFIQQVNFGVLYDEEDKPKWPKNKPGEQEG